MIMKILRNKKILAIIALAYIVSIAGLYLYLQRLELFDEYESGETIVVGDTGVVMMPSLSPQEQELLDNPTQDDLYEIDDFGSTSIQLPEIWDNKIQDYSKEDHEYNYAKSESSDDAFEFEVNQEYVSEEMLDNYKSEDIDNQALYSPIEDYREEDFEEIAVVNGHSILVSKLGGVGYQGSVLVGETITPDWAMYVYQKYEREDGTFGLSFEITAFDERIDEPIAYQNTTISYTIHSSASVANWDSYKKVLKKAIESMR